SAIVDSAHDAIVSKTLDGTITSWNKAAERMFGYTAAEVVGKSVRIIIPSDRQVEEDYILSQISGGDRVDHFETVRQTKDGRLLEISLTISPIRDAHGKIIGASKIARDITEQKRLERERAEILERERTAREQLAEAVAARDEFIAVAAHELRNPLNVLVLTLQLLHRVANSGNSEQIGSLIERSRAQLARLSGLIDRLLDVSRIRTGFFDLYRERFNLCALISEVANRFSIEYSAAPISLELTPPIEGDWDRLRVDQAITNLISNAITYGMQKPIVVRASSDGRNATVIVRDNGAGIPPDDLDRIFDRFERAAERSSKRGLGLGLWITKRIVEAHGGTVRAESELGKGSSFTMQLPLHS
ncbi:MAG TPA: PAS domain S-box protein, partial [Candidatus Binataceae bacterium]|nr:PAS domain S-box protein [Candidatus Binataceae bacterium]